MGGTQKVGTALDTTSTTGADSAPMSSAGNDTTPAGMAAVSRMAAVPAVATSPTFMQALQQQIGAFATTLGLTDASIFQPIVTQIVNDVAAKDTATSSSTSATGATPAAGTTPAVPAAPPPSFTQDLQNEILSHVNSVEKLLPADVQAKISAYTSGHPAALYAELLVAALSDYFSGIKPPALSHKFDLGSGFSVTPKVQTGTIHEKFIQSIGATIDWKGGDKDKFLAEAGINHDFTADTTAFNVKLEDTDLEILKQKVDASFAYTHTDYPGGKSPGDKFVESLKLAHGDWTVQYQNSLSFTAGKPNKKEQYGPRVETDTNTLDVTKKNAIGDVTLQGEGNFNIGGTSANNVGLKASVPVGSTGYTFSVEDIQSIGGGPGGAGNGFGVALQKGNLTLSITDMPTGMKGMTGDATPTYSDPIKAPTGRAITFGVSFKF